MAMTMCISQEPILSKLDRLDNMLRQLEEVRGCNIYSSCSSSTPSSGTLTSVDYLSPKSIEKHCRPIEHVVTETEMKGTLIERLHHVEDRVLKLCLQLEEELVAKRRKEEVDAENQKKQNKKKIGIIKNLVKHCVRN